MDLQYFLGNSYFLTSFVATFLFFALNVVLVVYYLKSSKASSPSVHIPDILYLVFSVAFLIILRWYTLHCEITNLDESFHLAIAQSFSSGHHFWIDFDPSSVGPVNTLIFYVASLFTGEMSYFTAKLVALLILIITQIYMYLALIRVCSRSVAIPLLSCFAFYMVQPWSAPVVSYNSEYSLFLFLSIYLFLYARFNESKVARIFSFGVLAVLPFCKLQFAPLALFLYIFGLWKLFRRGSASLFWKEFILVLLISSLPPVLLIIDCVIHDSFIWFYRFFFQNMVSYVDVKVTAGDYWKNLMYMAEDNLFLIIFSLMIILLSLLAIGLRKWRIVLFVWLILSISLYEVLKPNFPFLHYLNILILPCIFCVSILASAVKSRLVYAVVAVISLGYQTVHIYDYDKDFDHRLAILTGSTSGSFWKSVALDIKKMSLPGDHMAVWGWVDELYVYSGIPSGTAEIAIGGFVPSKLIDRHYPSYTLEKYRDDLINNKPRFFVDTPSPVTKIYDSYSYSVIYHPEISGIIKDNYHIKKQYFYPVDNVSGCDFSLKGDDQKGCVITLYELNQS